MTGTRETFITYNPATNEPLAELAIDGPREVDQAVDTAGRAFRAWSALTGAQRGRILAAAARLLRERTPELARLECLDTGKPITEALTVDLPSAADCLEYYAGLAATLHGEHVELGAGKSFFYTRREPLGVCAGIGAWNYPLQIAAWKCAPALAAGNSMIFKPAELTPLSAPKLAEIFRDAGAPEGLLAIVQGPASTGRLLTKHPRIAKISLTGEVSTGKAVMADAADTLKRVTLELGGKSPLIIFADTPPKRAASAALLANFYTQGEVCSNGTRVFVEKKFHAAFLEELLPRVAKIRVGDPLDPQTQMGALISPEHLEKVIGFIEQGKKEGARLLCGGTRPHPKGNFITPAVFDGCDDEMKIVRQEIFGPVMSILTFETEDEVIERANATTYGLSAGVLTENLARAHRVIARLEAGTCWINTYNITPVEMPFGGNKWSGIGRENGRAALEHYTQLKSVYVETGELESPY